MPQIHPLQYEYGDATGATLLTHSLRSLLEREPDLLLPGRGPAIMRPAETCGALIERLETFCRELYHGDALGPDPGFFHLSEHLLQSRRSSCTWYAVLSGDGHALAIDVGYGPPALADPCYRGYHTRFLPDAVHALKRDHGVTQIDAVIVTHYHDDHLIGIPYLQRRFDTKVWCLDRVAPILREPSRFNLPCLLPTPIAVDRAIPDRDTFQWRGITFQMHDLPGQTDLHGGVSFDLDQKRYLAMGDSAHLRDGKLAHGHVIFANRVTGRNHLLVAERFLEIQPDVLLHGHHRRQENGQGRGDTPVSQEDLVHFHQSALRLDAVLSTLVVDEPARRCRADWVRIEPYRLHLGVGDSAEFHVVAENLENQPMELELSLVAPEGIDVDPMTATCRIPPGSTNRSAHHVVLEQVPGPSPGIVCVDVRLNGRPLGWLGHGQVWFEGVPR